MHMQFIQQAGAWILALFQFLGLTAGIIPFDTDVGYGGTKFVEPAVADWLTLSDAYVIVTPENPDPAEVTAAKELQSYLKEIGGLELDIVDETAVVDQKEILIGATKLYDASSAFAGYGARGEDGFLLKAAGGGRLIIAGGSPRGTLYGVYAFLEEQLGCRWYTPTVSFTPTPGEVKVNAALDDLQIPDFELRRDNAKGADARYNAIKRNNVPIWSGDPRYGGGMGYVTWDVTLDKLVPDALYAAHQDYFAWRVDQNKRTTAHVCMSSEGAFQEALKNAKTAIDADTRGAKHIHIGQKDNSDYCQCDICLAAYEKYGSISGPTIVFANRLAEELEKAGYEGMSVTFFAYNETEHPTTDPDLRCRDNVIPVICGSHHACNSHPYCECGQYRDGNFNLITRFSPLEPWFANDIERWVEITERTYIYEYSINFLNSAQFFANFGTLRRNAAWMLECGVTGYTYTCGDGHDAAFNELRNYLLPKIYWDTDCDVEYHMMEFLKGYYGEAAAVPLKQYIDFVTAKTASIAHAFDFDWHYQAGYFDPISVCKLDKLWEAALAADGTPAQKYRVGREECYWRYYKSNLYLGEFFMLSPLRPQMNEKLYDDFLAHGVERVTAFGVIPPKDQVDFVWARPFNWR